jgi:hypothetical protein
MMHYAVKINTSSDSNGNRRRGWLVYSSDGVRLGFLKEDAGDFELYQRFPDSVIVLCSLNVIPAEYIMAMRGPLIRKRP